ncbi:unnamed protein product [Amoebophrya sp. A25]|nr:unnamed protein product [Amoebophrya sp. A25]|eukprot:GSA25T00007498001.1
MQIDESELEPPPVRVATPGPEPVELPHSRQRSIFGSLSKPTDEMALAHALEKAKMRIAPASLSKINPLGAGAGRARGGLAWSTGEAILGRPRPMDFSRLASPRALPPLGLNGLNLGGNTASLGLVLRSPVMQDPLEKSSTFVSPTALSPRPDSPFSRAARQTMPNFGGPSPEDNDPDVSVLVEGGTSRHREESPLAGDKTASPRYNRFEGGAQTAREWKQNMSGSSNASSGRSRAGGSRASGGSRGGASGGSRGGGAVSSNSRLSAKALRGVPGPRGSPILGMESATPRPGQGTSHSNASPPRTLGTQSNSPSFLLGSRPGTTQTTETMHTRATTTNMTTNTNSESSPGGVQQQHKRGKVVLSGLQSGTGLPWFKFDIEGNIVGEHGSGFHSVFLPKEEPERFYRDAQRDQGTLESEKKNATVDKVLCVLVHMGSRKIWSGVTVDLDREVEEEPRFVLDNCYGQSAESGAEMFFDEALKQRGNLPLTWPMYRGVCRDFDVLEKIWRRLFLNPALELPRIRVRTSKADMIAAGRKAVMKIRTASGASKSFGMGGTSLPPRPPSSERRKKKDEEGGKKQRMREKAEKAKQKKKEKDGKKKGGGGLLERTVPAEDDDSDVSTSSRDGRDEQKKKNQGGTGGKQERQVDTGSATSKQVGDGSSSSSPVRPPGEEEVIDAEEASDEETEVIEWPILRYPVIITEQPWTSRRNRETMVKMLFDSFDAEAVCFAQAATLELCAHGKSTGCVLHIGHAHCSAVCIYEGYLMPHTLQKSHFGSEDVVKMFLKHLQEEKGVELAGDDIDHEHAVEKILRSSGAVLSAGAGGNTELRVCGKKPYEDPFTGKTTVIGTERLRCFEGLFNPEIFECLRWNVRYKAVEATPLGIHELAFHSINQCRYELRRELYLNIVLSGGLADTHNMPERIRHEIADLPYVLSTYPLEMSDELKGRYEKLQVQKKTKGLPPDIADLPPEKQKAAMRLRAKYGKKEEEEEKPGAWEAYVGYPDAADYPILGEGNHDEGAESGRSSERPSAKPASGGDPKGTGGGAGTAAPSNTGQTGAATSNTRTEQAKNAGPGLGGGAFKFNVVPPGGGPEAAKAGAAKADAFSKVANLATTQTVITKAAERMEALRSRAPHALIEARRASAQRAGDKKKYNKMFVPSHLDVSVEPPALSSAQTFRSPFNSLIVTSNSAYLGAALLASMDSVEKHHFNRDDYEEEGPEGVHEKGVL